MSSVQNDCGGDAARPLTRWQRAMPALTLLVLAPVVANVLFGAIRLTFILAVLPATAAWGLGALLIREVVRRRRQGWTAILTLGLALALAEECVFLQTSLLPLIGVDPDHVYGRAFGVNWPYLLWALGYEPVWAVALPILFVEWIFPDRSNRPWLGNTGTAMGLVAFVAMGVIRWYGWTQVFVPQNFPAWAHQPSFMTILCALAAIILLLVIALGARPSPDRELASERPAPPLWRVGTASLAGGLVWSTLLFLAYGAAPAVPAAVAVFGGIAVAGAASVIVVRWTHRSKWDNLHTLMLASGALLASMSAGFLILKGSGAPSIDFVGKAILNILALFLLLFVGTRFAKARTGIRRNACDVPGASMSDSVPGAEHREPRAF